MATRKGDSEDEAPKKAQRVSRACLRCRSRKDRCDGGQQCNNCMNAGHECIYVVAEKKRGLPEGYVRGLEKLWGLVLQQTVGLDDAVRSTIDQNEDELRRLWNHSKHGDELHTQWKQSEALAGLEKLLTQSDSGGTSVSKRKRDGSEDQNAFNLEGELLNHHNTLRPTFEIVFLPERIGEPGTLPRSSSTHLTPKSASMRTSELATMQLPSSASRLLDHYFTYTHCWFPILERPYTLRKFYESKRSSGQSQTENSDLACLWALCAYSEQQIHGSGSTRRDFEPSSLSVDEMRRNARGLVPNEGGPFAIGHVDALLLLSLLEIGSGNWTAASILVGTATRALLGATNDLSTADKGWQAALRGCLILDTFVSLPTKTPCHLRDHSMRQVPGLDEAAHEEWEPWTANKAGVAMYSEPAFVMSCFNRLTEVCMILNQLRDISELPETEQSSHLQIANQLQRLADKYPFRVFEVLPRPPHQLFLQACHLLASVMASPNAAITRSQLAWKWLESIELFEQTYNQSDLHGIPSLLEGVVLLGYSRLSSSAMLSGIESRDLYTQRLNNVISKLSTAWPGLKDLIPTIIQPASQQSIPSNIGFPSIYQDSQQGNGWLQQEQLNQYIPAPSNAWKRQKRQQSTALPSPSQVTLSSQANSTTTRIPTSPEDTNFEQMDYMSIEQPMATNQPRARRKSNRQGSFAGGSVSSNFDGDEIDALFNEMAQLDTTQWSHDRTQGLRDFGFADDSMFEAFCNDPERLYFSEIYPDATAADVPGYDVAETPFGVQNESMGPQGYSQAQAAARNARLNFAMNMG